MENFCHANEAKQDQPFQLFFFNRLEKFKASY